MSTPLKAGGDDQDEGIKEDKDADDEEIKYSEIELEELEVVDFSGICRSRGLHVSGTKAELVERLMDAVPAEDGSYTASGLRFFRVEALKDFAESWTSRCLERARSSSTSWWRQVLLERSRGVRTEATMSCRTLGRWEVRLPVEKGKGLSTAKRTRTSSRGSCSTRESRSSVARRARRGTVRKVSKNDPP